MLRRKSGEDGVVAVEFVLISFPMFLLLLCIADFGDAWLRKQVITNIAREGARYGAVYTSPKRTEADIQKYITDLKVPITLDSVTAPAAGGATGTALTVTVQATKTWYVLDFIVGPTTQMTAISTMRNE
jgi:Flp pilus assembly protein TadG